MVLEVVGLVLGEELLGPLPLPQDGEVGEVCKSPDGVLLLPGPLPHEGVEDEV